MLLEARATGVPVAYPAVALVASGGHTHLFEITGGGAYRLMGKTRDDAAGEAYDKVAKLLGFSYPGGPILDRLAPFGNAAAIRFTASKMKGNALDFSFSGLKTAVLRWVEAQAMEEEIAARRSLRKRVGRPSVEEWLAATPPATLDLVASFQQTVVNELLRRLRAAVAQTGARTAIVSGGVACNAGLRAAAGAADVGCPVLFPTPGLSTDNAAMIAAAAFGKAGRREFAGWDLRAKAALLPG